MKVWGNNGLGFACIALLLLPGMAIAVEAHKPAAEILDFRPEGQAAEPVPAEENSTNDIKKILTDYYRQTSTFLKNVDAYRNALDSYETSLEEAPIETRKIRKQLARPLELPSTESMSIADDVPLPEIGQRLFKERDQLDEAIQKLTEQSAKLEEQKSRPAAIQERLQQITARMQEIEMALTVPAAEGQLKSIAEARRWALEAEQLALEAETRMLEAEIRSHEVRLALLEARQAEYKREVERIQQRVNLLAQSMNQRITSQLEIAEHTGEREQQLAAAEEASSLREELEKQRMRLEKKIDFSGNISMAVKNQQGNTDKSETELDGELDLRRVKDRFNVKGHLENDKAKSVQTAYNWFLISKYDYFVSKKLFYGAGLSFEQDEFADLNLRTKLGPHVGYQFYESRAMNLEVQAGVSLVSEDFYANSDLEYAGASWSLSFDKYYFDELFQFYAYQSGLNEFGRDNKMVIKTWVGLRFPLLYKFFLAVELKREYDSQPAAGKLKLDTTQSLKIGYKW